MVVDEQTKFFTDLQWAKILVKIVGRDLPNSIQVIVGLGRFSVQLWWEIPPWFVQVLLSRGSCMNRVKVAREEDERSPHAAFSRSPKG